MLHAVPSSVVGRALADAERANEHSYVAIEREIVPAVNDHNTSTAPANIFSNIAGPSTNVATAEKMGFKLAHHDVLQTTEQDPSSCFSTGIWFPPDLTVPHLTADDDHLFQARLLDLRSALDLGWRNEEVVDRELTLA